MPIPMVGPRQAKNRKSGVLEEVATGHYPPVREQQCVPSPYGSGALVTQRVKYVSV